MASEAKASSPAPRPAPPLPPAHDQDGPWVAKLTEKNRVAYYQARLAFAQAEDKYEDAVAKAAADRDKPQAALDAAKDVYRKALEAKDLAMAAAAEKKKDIEKALAGLDPAVADDAAKSTAQAAALQKAIDDYNKVGVAAVAKAVADVTAADSAVRKQAEDKPGVSADKLELDPDDRKIGQKTYELAVATAADPLDDARKAFDSARGQIIGTLARP